jgi:hypothetical protein
MLQQIIKKFVRFSILGSKYLVAVPSSELMRVHLGCAALTINAVAAFVSPRLPAASSCKQLQHCSGKRNCSFPRTRMQEQQEQPVEE